MRVALHTKVREDRVEEYEAAHCEVPKELTDAIRAAGATSWTIWSSGTDLTFVLDHLGKPPIASGALEPRASDFRALAALPNTVCKLSGMVTETDPRTWRSGRPTGELRSYADTALDAFGPGRLMFGSDWPVCTLAASYTDVAHGTEMLLLGLSAGDKREIPESTATRVYGL